MFSYRHVFHAGNHADVLKHTVLLQLLDYLNQKETAYTVVDTHAGAGVYTLDGEFAAKSQESDSGIAKLWDRKDLPAAVAHYVKLIKSMNPSGKMRFYPGSPFCAEKTMRQQDRLRLFEMHSTEIKILEENCRKVEAHAAAQGQRSTVRGKRKVVVVDQETGAEEEHLVPLNKHLIVLKGDSVKKGQQLTEGPVPPHDILDVLGPQALQEHLVNEVQEVYRLQGVFQFFWGSQKLLWKRSRSFRRPRSKTQHAC